MAITGTVKEFIKNILSIDIVDLEGEINSKGNYLYLSGFEMVSVLKGRFEYTLMLADKSFSGSDEAIEPLLDAIISDIATEKTRNATDIVLSKAHIRKKDALFIYEVKIYIERKVV